MTQAELLEMLKLDLGITVSAYDVRLYRLLMIANGEIIREGAASLDTASTLNDANLVIMYAAWLWRRRDTMEGMPRMLRWALNNRIFAEKMRQGV